KAAPLRPFAQLPEIVRSAIDAAQGKGRDVGADEQQVGAQLLHHVELALGAVERPLPMRRRHALEVAERLEQADLESMVADHPAYVGGAAIEGEEVILENLHAVEAGLGDGGELFGQVAADRDSRDRGL